MRACVQVVVVEGDIAMPGLGLSAADSARLRAEVNIILHNAARCG